jgi:hypothetical protein
MRDELTGYFHKEVLAYLEPILSGSDMAEVAAMTKMPAAFLSTPVDPGGDETPPEDSPARIAGELLALATVLETLLRDRAGGV